MKFEVEKRREQWMFEQAFETIIASYVFKQAHFSCLANFLTIRIVRHQTVIVELKPVLVRLLLLYLDAIVEITR